MRKDPLPYSVVTVDIEQFSRRSSQGHLDLRKGLRGVLKEAAAQAGIDRSAWKRQDGGDSEVAMVPASVPKVRLAADFVNELLIALTAFNQPRAEHERMRLRVALNHGDSHIDGTGYTGDAVIAACRMLDAEATKAALKAVPEANLVVVLSDGMYRDVIEHRGLHQREFQRVDVAVKEFSRPAWIRVPGHLPPWPVGAAGGRDQAGPSREASQRPAKEPAGSRRGGPGPADRGGSPTAAPSTRAISGGTFSGPVNLGDGPFAGRDLHLGTDRPRRDDGDDPR